MTLDRKRLRWFLVLAAVVTLVGLALRPSPLLVDTAVVVRGPLQVTVDEEGETRVRDRYVIAAPVAGRLSRIRLDEGDPVMPGSLLAYLHPTPLDPRLREQAQASLRAAEASKREADALVDQALATLGEARRIRQRQERLAAEEVIPLEEIDRARTAEQARQAELEAARYRAQAASFEVASARAALMATEAATAHDPTDGDEFPIHSPIEGRVLRVCEECDRVVEAGTPLLELGDPRALEIVADVLTTEAVKIPPGAPMWLEGWGGEQPLRARVRLVEPSAFKKVSPLGIEEQRVRVIGDFVDPPEGLGDGFRVEAKMVVWEAADVLKVPAGSVFRAGERWAVFVVGERRAREREVTLGHRGALEIEVLEGLTEGDVVIVHPGDRVGDGARVKAR